jgi:hypothetical protein
MSWMGMLVRAIRKFCTASCSREVCLGCPFERHSERKRQINLFIGRRERVAAWRREAVR